MESQKESRTTAASNISNDLERAAAEANEVNNSYFAPPDAVHSSDEYTVASTITCGLQDADLFVPSMYPSTNNIEDAAEAIRNTQPSGGMLLPPLAEETVVSMDDKTLKLEKEPLSGREAPVTINGSDNLKTEKEEASENPVRFAVKNSLDQLPNKEQLLDQPVADSKAVHITGSQQEKADAKIQEYELEVKIQSQNHDDTTRIPNERDSARNGGLPPLLGGLPMALPEPSRRSPHESTASIPGAHASIPGAHAFYRPRYISSERATEPEVEDLEEGDNNQGLAEARPVMDQDQEFTSQAIPMSTNGSTRSIELWKTLLIAISGLLIIAGILAVDKAASRL